MIPFSYRTFRDYLRKPLERSEIQFLIRTFSLSGTYFFLFAVLCITFHAILDSLLGQSRAIFSLICFLFGVAAYIPLSFFRIRYQSSPLRMPTSFVTVCFITLTAAKLFLFIGAINSLYSFAGINSFSSIYLVILAVFGVTVCIYAIPAIIALFIINRKTVLSLDKFLNFCYLFYFVLFLLSIFVCIFGYSEVGKGLSTLFFLVTSAILFISPIITIYRMKTVVPYINYEDPLERKRWENYFVFEIAIQLLQLAWHILRIAVMLLGRTSSASRLR